MKRILLFTVIIITVFLSLAYFTPEEASNNSNNKDQITLGSIQSDIKKGALLIDVRTVEEFSESHAKGAVNLPVEKIETGSRPDVAKEKTIYLYCRSGRRAKIAEDILKKDGYIKVVNLESLEKWKSLGGQTTN